MNLKKEFNGFVSDKKAMKLSGKVTTLSFLGFMVLTSVIPTSSYTLFNYFLKEALLYATLGVLVVGAFSVSLGLMSGYLSKKHTKLWGEKTLILIGIFWLINFYLMLSRTSYSIFSYTQMNGFVYTTLSMVLSALIIPMIGILLVNVYKTIKNRNMSVSSSGGLLAWVFSVGCPSCGAILYSALGLSAGLAVLPFQGLELKFLSLGLVGFSIMQLSPQKKKHKFNVIKKDPKLERFDTLMLVGIFLVAAVMGFNQIQIQGISSALGGPSILFMSNNQLAGTLADVDISALSSTAATVASVFPELQSAKTEEEVMQIMMPSGVPEYSEILGGVSFDDPLNSLGYLAKWYYVINEEVKNNPESWERYLNLAAAPRGVSCEYCCGVGPQGVTADGRSKCGCQHHPALLAVTLGLIENTDYSDAQVLREVMNWKTTFFPRNMVAVGIDVAGKDPAKVSAAGLNTMVGGC
ncbi:MAG: hypothetical protein GOU98_01045 [Candidatus Altiarchaeota archaeon]|nr:hypothetical protein [Candidatus Altiarchaeota archaeon]